MKGKLTSNALLKIASLFFAFLLWLVVNNMNDPTIDRSFSNIPVKLLNTELITDSGQVYEILENSAVIDRVTVRAPRTVISSLNSGNIIATADVSELSSLDTITIRLSTNLNNNDIEKITGSNDTVKLNIEDKKTKSLALKITVSGEVEEGYLVGEITSDTNLIRISGPESIVNTIAKAVADVPVTGFTTDISDNAEIKLYNSEDELIRDERITQNIKTVGVKVALYRTMQLPLVFNIQGTPANGYRVAGDVNASLESVLLAGKESALRNVNVIEIPAEAINVTGEKADLETNIDIKKYLPEGTFLANSSESRVNVSVKILPEVTKELAVEEGHIQVTGIPEGYRATMEELGDDIRIEVRGLATDVAELNSSALRGVVNIEKWMEEQKMTEPVEGYYHIDVDFNLTENVSLRTPLSVMVHLSKIEE